MAHKLLAFPERTITAAIANITSTTSTAAGFERLCPSLPTQLSRSFCTQSSVRRLEHGFHSRKKHKKTFPIASNRPRFRMGYPLNCDFSAEPHKRSKFTPCKHEGPCSLKCCCVNGRIHCEKTCGCHPVPSQEAILLT